MTRIPLSNGGFALIDDADAATVSGYKWRRSLQRRARTGCSAVVAWGGAGRPLVLMHRLILGIGPDDGRVVDHINGDPLDNRKNNLRICSRAENAKNRRRAISNKSGYKGVYRDSAPNRGERTGRVWRAVINADGRRHSLGYYETPEMAHAAYSEAAARLHGEFARLD